MELKQHNYINFSSVLSIRWESEPQRKPSLLPGVTWGREMPGTVTVAKLETRHHEVPTLSKWDLKSAALFSVIIPNYSACAVRLWRVISTRDRHPW